MEYLIDLADQGIAHNIPDLRERVQQLLNLIPSGFTQLHFCIHLHCVVKNLFWDKLHLKGRGHNRLISKFGPFFIFGQICLIFGM